MYLCEVWLGCDTDILKRNPKALRGGSVLNDVLTACSKFRKQQLPTLYLLVAVATSHLRGSSVYPLHELRLDEPED